MMNYCYVCGITFDDEVYFNCPICSCHTDLSFKKDSKGDKFTKPLTEELVPEFLIDMAKVLMYGGNKYGFKNWRKATKEDLHHYEGALMRHFLTWQTGDIKDKDTNLNHLVHTAINAMFLYWHTQIKDNNGN